MKKVVLFLVAICGLAISCSKTTKVPVAYNVQTLNATTVQDLYIPDTGSYDMPIHVKFLTGNTTDKVTLILNGLPADVKVTKDTISDVPTFIAHFIFTTNHAKQAKYPVTIVATAPGELAKTYNFNLTVIPANCASYLLGTFTGSNACTARSFTYPADVTSPAVNKLSINNFGGYGTGTNTIVDVNCNHDSLTIPSQNIGNGTTLSGYGVFSSNKMTIYYTAINTPGGFPETCTATLTK